MNSSKHLKRMFLFLRWHLCFYSLEETKWKHANVQKHATPELWTLNSPHVCRYFSYQVLPKQLMGRAWSFLSAPKDYVASCAWVADTPGLEVNHLHDCQLNLTSLFGSIWYSVESCWHFPCFIHHFTCIMQPSCLINEQIAINESFKMYL